jgi:FAD/FMN-containing dehydrogenase
LTCPTDLSTVIRAVTVESAESRHETSRSDERVRAAYGEASYRRLTALKRAWDPDNLFRLNQNIAPG